MDEKIIAAIITGFATLASALIVGIAGTLITRIYGKQRDRQDKESQWRDHAIELTKLDLQRKTLNNKNSEPLRPSILDFLANYRDLKELDKESPGDLYKKIWTKRIKKTKTKREEKDDPQQGI